jgi:predicted Zn finger-like uncharacterized protein
MLIRCPSCSVAFNVPTAAIGEAGRKVKCTKCAHIWFQEPLKQKDLQEFLNIDERLKPLHENDKKTHLPSKIQSYFSPFKIATLAVLFVLFIVTSLINYNQKFPVVTRLLSMEPTEGLHFSNFDMVKSIVDNKYVFTITGFLVNSSDIEKKIPKITVKVYTKAGRVLQTQKLIVEQKTIPAKSQIAMNKKITEVSGNADKIELIIGNPWERFF